MLLLVRHIVKHAKKKRKKKKTAKKDNDRSFIERFGTMNLILVFIAITFIVFTVAMIIVFCKYQAIPDTLVASVFSVLGGECGVMGWIKNSKDRRIERTFQLEDEKRERRYREEDDSNNQGS